MGAAIVYQTMKNRGHDITQLCFYYYATQLERPTTPREGRLKVFDTRALPKPDAWFVSVIETSTWMFIRRTFERMKIHPLAKDRAADDPLVAFGGQSMAYAEPLADFADVLCLGDGELTAAKIGDLLDRGCGRMEIMEELAGRDGFYVPLRQRPPAPFRRVEMETYEPMLIVPTQTKGMQSGSVEIARGCKSRCNFCTVGWAGGTYREADPAKIAAIAKQAAGHRLYTYAPDFSALSWADEVDGLLETHGCKIAQRRSARIDYTLNRFKRGGEDAHSYNFGVEGLTEELRNIVAKPLPDKTIIDCMGLLESRVSSVKWYVIMGLPGETDDDLDEFVDLLHRVRKVYSKILVIVATQLQPFPHTPFQWLNAHRIEEAAARQTRLRNLLIENKELNRGGPGLAMCAPPRRKDVHEHDTWLCRQGREASRYLLRSLPGYIKTGKWREIAAQEGFNVEAGLSEIGVNARTPWSHIDVGMTRTEVLRAWIRWQRLVDKKLIASQAA